MSKREDTRKGLQIIASYAFMAFNSWGFIQIEAKKSNNRFLSITEAILKQSFFLAVANFFDETKGTLSIKSYLKLLLKSPKKEDIAVLKTIKTILSKNKNEISLLIKHRGVDLAHINKEIAFAIFQKKRGTKYEEVAMTGAQVIELLTTIEDIIDIIDIIEKHELGGKVNIKRKVFTAMNKDRKKVFKN